MADQLAVPKEAIITGDSGNGAHVLIRADIAAEPEGDALVRDILAAVDLTHTDGRVTIDTGVSNRARIWRLYGTAARKGDSTPERPHRRSRLLDVPQRIAPCPLDILRRIAALAPRPAVTLRPAFRMGCPWGRGIDLGAWVRKHLHVYYVRERPDGSTTWVVRCPWREHGNADRGGYVMRLACGAIAAGCLHNHCRGQSWRSLRALYNPTVRAVEAALLREVMG